MPTKLRALVMAVALLLLAGCSAGPVGERVESVQIASADGQLVGTLEVPQLKAGEKVPLVILMHGFQGFHDEPHLKRTAEQLRQAGIASIRMDFTGHGLSDGTLGSFGAELVTTELGDLQAIYDHVTSLGFVSGVSLAGYSLGGLVAAMFAGEHPADIDSVVLLAPAAPYGIYLPVYDTAAEYDGPVLILQGDSDDLVSVQVAETYAAAFANAELRVLEHENHSFTYGTDVDTMTVEFIAGR